MEVQKISQHFIVLFFFHDYFAWILYFRVFHSFYSPDYDSLFSRAIWSRLGCHKLLLVGIWCSFCIYQFNLIFITRSVISDLLFLCFMWFLYKEIGKKNSYVLDMYACGTAKILPHNDKHRHLILSNSHCWQRASNIVHPMNNHCQEVELKNLKKKIFEQKTKNIIQTDNFISS